MKPFKKNTALCGIGYWGKNLARNLNGLNALHTICDPNVAQLELFRSHYSAVHFETSFDRMLQSEEIENVFIAAPAVLHYELTKAALLAGKDVYVEKPLCLESIQGKELVELAEKTGKILMVGHLLHYHPCVQKLQGMVAEKQLGALQYITSNRLNLGAYRLEENALWNFAPHDVSVILSLCGNQMPEHVYCMGGDYITPGIADTAVTLLKFPGNLRAHIFVSWLNPFKEQKLTVVGEKGMVVFDDTKVWEEKLVFYKNHLVWEGNVPKANPVEGHPVEVEQREPLKEECIHFLRCCEERKTPLTDGAEALRTLQVLEMAQESMSAK